MRLKSRAVIIIDGALVVTREHRRERVHLFLPGGRARAGEPAEDAVVREVLEETDLRVAVVRLLYVAEVIEGVRTHDLNLVFLAEPVGPVPGGLETVGLTAVADVYPPVLDTLAIDHAAGWEETPRWLGDVRRPR